MAEYYMPYVVETTDGGTYCGLRYIRTFGRRRPPRVDPWQTEAKKRLDNPQLWAQLEAISKGTWVNHLGRGHARSEYNYHGPGHQYEFPSCLACIYGNTAVYLHNH